MCIKQLLHHQKHKYDRAKRHAQMVNQFFVDVDADASAAAVPDAHVGKIALESAQVCYGALILVLEQAKVDVALFMATAPICISTGKPGYRKTHANHPFGKFVRRCPDNWQYFLARAQALAREHTFRSARGTAHSVEAHIAWLMKNPPPAWDGTHLPLQTRCASVKGLDDRMPVSVPDEVAVDDDIVASYRAVYKVKAVEFKQPMRWTRRSPPEWLRSVIGRPIFKTARKADGASVYTVQ